MAQVSGPRAQNSLHPRDVAPDQPHRMRKPLRVANQRIQRKAGQHCPDEHHASLLKMASGLFKSRLRHTTATEFQCAKQPKYQCHPSTSPVPCAVNDHASILPTALHAKCKFPLDAMPVAAWMARLQRGIPFHQSSPILWSPCSAACTLREMAFSALPFGLRPLRTRFPCAP